MGSPSTLAAAFCIAMPFVAADRALKLTAPSLWAFAAVNSPGNLVGGLGLGWVAGSAFLPHHLWPTVGLCACAFVAGLAVVVGLYGWQRAPLGALTVFLWGLGLTRWAASPRLGLAMLICSVSLQVGTLVLVLELTDLRRSLPMSLQGTCIPLMLFVYKAGGFAILSRVWTCLYQEGVDTVHFTCVCAMLVQTTETLRLVALQASALSTKGEHEYMEVAVNLATSFCTSLLFRGQVVAATLWHALGWELLPTSPEMDVFLRLRFVHGVAPLLPLLGTVPVAVWLGRPGAWARDAHFWLLGLAALAVELAGDVCFALTQQRGGESLCATLRRLQRPGAHEALPLQRCCRRRSSTPPPSRQASAAGGGPPVAGAGAARESAEGGQMAWAAVAAPVLLGKTQLEAGVTVEEAPELSKHPGKRSPVRLLLEVCFLTYMTVRIFEAAVIGLLDPCGFAAPQELC